jgi:hypothetical protein
MPAKARKCSAFTFVAAVESAAAGQPGHRSLHHPAVAPQTLRGFDAPTGDAVAYAVLREPSTQVVIVVAFAAVEFFGPLAVGADGRDATHQRYQCLAVMDVGRGDPQRERQSVAVDDEVDFRSVLAPVGRLRSRQWPIFAARTVTESIAHLDQSSSPSAPNSSRMTRWSLAQTRALLHRAKRR